MQIKALEKIKEHSKPLEKLPVEYIIKSSVEEIEGEKVLFLSFFSQRYIKEKADFKVFIYGQKYISEKLQMDNTYRLSMASIENLVGYWSYGYNLKAACSTQYEKENILNYFGVSEKESTNEYKLLIKFQQKIMQDRLEARHNAIKKKIDDVMVKIPELPKDFSKWVDNGPFHFSRYIYYKRVGKKIAAYCTHCKKDFEIKETKSTKESIKHNNLGICPECNKKITYKAIGKTTRLEDSCQFAIIQRFEDSIVVRTFYGIKGYCRDYKNPRLHYWERVREIYKFEDNFLNGTRYEYRDFLQTGHVRWCDDSAQFPVNKVYLYTKNLNSVLKGTKWQYSCMYDFAKQIKNLYTSTFLREYVVHPAIEYLIKLKLFNFVDDNLNHRSWRSWEGINFKGKNIKEVLGMDKVMLKQVQRLDLDGDGIELLKKAEKKGKKLTDAQVRWIISNDLDINSFISVLDYSNPQRIINYVKKQSNKDHKHSAVLTDWKDYIRQCLELKFDTNNSFVLYPKNLEEKHEEYSIMTKVKDLEKFDSKIAKAYVELDKLYTFSDKNYLIRPAMSTREIVTEGHRQRHCVGGRNYVSGVAEGRTAIMLLRKLESPNESFFTVELDPKTLSVKQCRGYKNCSAPEAVEKFMSKWKNSKLTIIKSKRKVG